jgi:epoxyqueuosine reductase QueG
VTRYDAVRNRIFAGSDMDYVGICPASALDGEPAGRRPKDLLPNAESIIVFGRRLISGSVQAKYRFFEDGVGNSVGSYSAHSFVLSINHLCMKETYDIAQYLETTYGCFAMPLTNNVLQAVQPEGNYVPFFADPYQAGLPVDIYKAAVAAGIGEMGWNHRVITPDCGPRIYLCAIVTSLAFEQYDKPYAGERLCDPKACGICARVCPTCALSAEQKESWHVGSLSYDVGKLDVNGCAVACFGFRKELNRMTSIVVENDHPDDEELAEALEKQFAAPGFQTLDHVPMFHCDRCMIYCPVGNWNEQFRDRGLTKGPVEK